MLCSSILIMLILNLTKHIITSLVTMKCPAIVKYMNFASIFVIHVITIGYVRITLQITGEVYLFIFFEFVTTQRLEPLEKDVAFQTYHFCAQS
jgi:hypothetical protein